MAVPRSSAPCDLSSAVRFGKEALQRRQNAARLLLAHEMPARHCVPLDAIGPCGPGLQRLTAGNAEIFAPHDEKRRRDAPNAAWKLYVSLTRPGAEPGPARELTAGSGSGAISPAVAALSSDRWLVQWTEGSSAQYHVHVQTFAADLSAIDANITVSPKGANAGQGALATFGEGAASLFILTTAGHDELWGATLSCANP